VDEFLSVILEYENNLISQFTCTTMSRTTNDFNIYGTEGAIRIHPGFWDSTGATLIKEGTEVSVSRPYRVNGFEYEIEEAMRCIREGRLESPEMTHQHTLANLGVMDQIRDQIGLRYPFE
jgi:predicted dehydrogenase